jgi:hypothetical protein
MRKRKAAQRGLRGGSMRTGILVAILTTTALPAYAAQIEAHNLNAITITGQINANDFETFKIKAGPLTKADVWLSSPGGDLQAAIKIGEFIRLRGWSTFVTAGCSSACALIWLGGITRYMTDTARIGFHAASVNGQEKGAGNAVIGAYMNRLGLSYDAVLFATTASPSDITYLTPDYAKRIGIEVTMIEEVPAAQQRPARQAIAPQVNPQSSFNTQASPGSPPASTPLGAIDYLTKHPYRGSTEGTVEDHVAFLLNLFFDSWNANYVTRFPNLYHDYVDYYGKTIAKEAALLDKQKFNQTWPKRSYRVRPNSLIISCEGDTAYDDVGIPGCVVEGFLDFEATNSMKRSTGSANLRFQYTQYPLEIGTWRPGTNERLDLRISYEQITVVQRQITDLH